jgi:hypothetical protein
MPSENYINAFEAVFKTEKAKNLLSKRWRQENNLAVAAHSTGFCYIAAEAIYHLLIERKPKVFCASYKDEQGNATTHWWIKVDGKIIDPTKSQYTESGEQPPYHLGIGKGFLTNKISKRGAKLMEMVMEELVQGRKHDE